MNSYDYVAFHDTDELFLPTFGSSLVDFIGRMEDKAGNGSSDDGQPPFTSLNFRSRYFPDARKYGKMPLAR